MGHYLLKLALFITGDSIVWLITTCGNFFLLFIVLFMIFLVVKFMYQD